MTALGETPIVKKLQQVKYPKEKLKKVTRAMKKLIPDRESSDSDEGEMITQLIDKFESASIVEYSVSNFLGWHHRYKSFYLLVLSIIHKA